MNYGHLDDDAREYKSLLPRAPRRGRPVRLGRLVRPVRAVRPAPTPHAV